MNFSLRSSSRIGLSSPSGCRERNAILFGSATKKVPIGKVCQESSLVTDAIRPVPCSAIRSRRDRAWLLTTWVVSQNRGTLGTVGFERDIMGAYEN